MSTLVTAAAAGLAAAAASLLIPGGRRSVRLGDVAAAGAPRDQGRWSPDRGAVASAAVGISVLALRVRGVHLAVGLVLTLTVLAGVVLLRRTRQAKEREARAAAVVEVCEAVVGELRAGQPLLRSLEQTADVWDEMGPVVAAGRLGADVPSALRRLAETPGAEGLRDLAAAWQVAQTSGAGLATALGQVARTARARQATRHLVRGELASAQATARLVAGLPLAVLAMSAGIGGHPWHFVLDTAAGVACLAGGLALSFAGLVWIDRIAVGVLRGE